MHRRSAIRASAAAVIGGTIVGRAAASNETPAPLSPQVVHQPAKARSVIFLFMAGGPSQLETFDPKPVLNRLHGQKRPAEFGDAKYQFVQSDAKLLGTKRRFRKHGESGIEVSDLFPHMSSCIDDFAVIRSCTGDQVVHSAAQYELLTGRDGTRVSKHGLMGVDGTGS